jgi:hypothetical protein
VVRRFITQTLAGVLVLVVGMLVVALGVGWGFYLVLPALLWIALLSMGVGPL